MTYIDECLERAERATKAPWKDNVWCGDYDHVWAATGPVHKQKPDEDELSDGTEAAEQAQIDAEFIAHAREDVPELCRRLQTAIDALRELDSEGYSNAALADELEKVPG